MNLSIYLLIYPSQDERSGDGLQLAQLLILAERVPRDPPQNYATACAKRFASCERAFWFKCIEVCRHNRLVNAVTGTEEDLYEPMVDVQVCANDKWVDSNYLMISYCDSIEMICLSPYSGPSCASSRPRILWMSRRRRCPRTSRSCLKVNDKRTDRKMVGFIVNRIAADSSSGKSDISINTNIDGQFERQANG